jgi:hypothetical protein
MSAVWHAVHAEVKLILPRLPSIGSLRERSCSSTNLFASTVGGSGRRVSHPGHFIPGDSPPPPLPGTLLIGGTGHEADVLESVMHLYLYIYVCIYRHIYRHIYMYISIHPSYISVSIYLSIYLYLFICLAIRLYIYISVYIYIYI